MNAKVEHSLCNWQVSSWMTLDAQGSERQRRRASARLLLPFSRDRKGQQARGQRKWAASWRLEGALVQHDLESMMQPGQGRLHNLERGQICLYMCRRCGCVPRPARHRRSGRTCAWASVPSRRRHSGPSTRGDDSGGVQIALRAPKAVFVLSA